MILYFALALAPLQGARMKEVVCHPIEEARDKKGAELAAAIEADVTRFAAARYILTALLPGDPPIACFHASVDSSKLPRGAR